MKKKAKTNELDNRIKKISKRLKQMRKDRGYTSAEHFAWENGLSRVQYWRMENGTNFTINSLLNILDAHDMTLEEFFKDII